MLTRTFTYPLALALTLSLSLPGCSKAQEASDIDAASKQPGAAAPICDQDTQTELSACWGERYAALDLAMSELYFSLPKSEKLLQAQRAWLKYRDAHCEYAHHATPQGSMYGMEASMCLSDITQQRIEILTDAKREGYGASY